MSRSSKEKLAVRPTPWLALALRVSGRINLALGRACVVSSSPTLPPSFDKPLPSQCPALPLATPPPPHREAPHQPPPRKRIASGPTCLRRAGLSDCGSGGCGCPPPPQEAAPRPSLRSHHSATPALRSSSCSPRPHAGVEPTQGLRVQGVLVLARPRGGEALPTHPGQWGGSGGGGGRGGGREVESVKEAGGDGGRHAGCGGSATSHTLRGGGGVRALCAAAGAGLWLLHS